MTQTRRVFIAASLLAALCVSCQNASDTTGKSGGRQTPAKKDGATTAGTKQTVADTKQTQPIHRDPETPVNSPPVRKAKFNRQVNVGDAAPVWTGLMGIDGKRKGIDDYKQADILVLAFTCNHCPVATMYEGRFIQFVRDYQKKGVAFVALSVSTLPADGLDNMKKRADEKGFNFDYLHDPGQAIGRAYGATVTPHLFVLNKARRIAYMGAFDDKMNPASVTRHYVRDAVDALLAGKQPEITETRQFGCAISYGLAGGETVGGAANPPAGKKPAPTGTVTLRTVNPAGYTAELKKHRGKVIVVDFWATWCIPCLKEFPHTIEWDKKFHDKGLVVISMNMDDTDKDSRTAALEFLKKQNATTINLHSSLGGEEAAMKAFSISDGALPHFKIYGRDGKLLKTFGFNPKKPLSHADIETALQDALKR